MWDLENCTLEEAKKTLKRIQKSHNLSDIFIVTDNDKTYRAWCFSKIDYATFLHILVDSLRIIDYSFFFCTIKRKKATLRTSNKKGRTKQKVVCVLRSYHVPIRFDCTVKSVVYDTGLEKRGISLLLGGE